MSGNFRWGTLKITLRVCPKGGSVRYDRRPLLSPFRRSLIGQLLLFRAHLRRSRAKLAFPKTAIRSGCLGDTFCAICAAEPEQRS
ncbi:protein of unknown function (plasmid) [Methylocella tundrae]|uniref:Uncharacterized protein n=1 Tax=Methylocella tundrae TaxID=227605 RepID=A0A4U8Z934_METTU|nr:protein of unknown function [Methylocella tundrae]